MMMPSQHTREACQHKFKFKLGKPDQCLIHFKKSRIRALFSKIKLGHYFLKNKIANNRCLVSIKF